MEGCFNSRASPRTLQLVLAALLVALAVGQEVEEQQSTGMTKEEKELQIAALQVSLHLFSQKKSFEKSP
jgi:hypothetical protein